MKRFLRTIAIHTVIGAVLLNVVGVAARRFPVAFYCLHPKDWLKICMRIESSRKKIVGDTIVVGGSVAHQFIPYRTRGYDGVLTSNGSVLPSGNYILIHNALQRNPQIKRVVYVSIPNTIGHKFERSRTYTHFIKPFVTWRALTHFDREEMAQIMARNSVRLNLLPFHAILPIPDRDLEDGQEKPFDQFSAFSLHWLHRIKQLCKEHETEFILVSPPLPQHLATEAADWKNMRAQLKDTDLEDVGTTYFSRITYHSDEFLHDGVHWTPEFVDMHRDAFLRSIRESTARMSLCPPPHS